MFSFEVDALVMLKPCEVVRTAKDKVREPQGEANDDEEEDTSSAERGSHRRVIWGVNEYQGRDAEEHIYYHRPNEGVMGDSAKEVIDGVEEVAEGPKKEEDRDMQEHMYPVHEPPHLEFFEASI